LLQNCVAADAAACTVLLARQRQFTFDHVYDQASTQQQVYTECVSDLVEACLEGYNATVLAYGPTGSGKTFTMGSASTLHSLPDEQGIIPRAIR
jgi:kinesin family protein 4/21/27